MPPSLEVVQDAQGELRIGDRFLELPGTPTKIGRTGGFGGGFIGKLWGSAPF